MDVSVPSNFERLQCFYSNDSEVLRSEIKGYSYNDEAICSAIREMNDRFGYLSCPHSATGYLAVKESGIDGFWLSTAHYAKFINVVSSAIGAELPLIEPFLSISRREGVHTDLSANADLVKSVIKAY